MDVNEVLEISAVTIEALAIPSDNLQCKRTSKISKT